MSTGTIIIIVAVAVVAIVVFGLLLAMPRMRVRKRERELQERRQQVVAQHRQEAELGTERAHAAEQQARLAAAEAQRERAEAELHEARANVHEQGLADNELIRADERKRFAGTSAVPAEGGDSRSRAEQDLASSRPESGYASQTTTRTSARDRVTEDGEPVATNGESDPVAGDPRPAERGSRA